MQRALDAIDRVFGDTSVSQEQTLEDMKELRDRVQSNMDVIEHDLGK